MKRWTLTISDETDRSLRTYLAHTGGKKGDLSSFVEQAVQAHLFDLTVASLKDRVAGQPADTILEAIRDACRNIRVAETETPKRGER
jgi:hypothetical protein